jgi:hypothetical protein
MLWRGRCWRGFGYPKAVGTKLGKTQLPVPRHCRTPQHNSRQASAAPLVRLPFMDALELELQTRLGTRAVEA